MIQSTFTRRIKSCVNASLIAYLVALFFFNKSYSVQFLVQIELTLLTLFCFNIGLYIKEIKKVLLLITLFQIISVLIIITHQVVDFTTPDGVNYRILARWYGILGEESVLAAKNIDDKGYCFIIGLSYKLFGELGGNVFISLFKILLHVWTCYILYILGKDFFSYNRARLIGLLWGLNLGSVYWNTAFLKEGIFCFIVVLATYELYKFYNEKGIGRYKYLVLFLVFSFLSVFFRLIVPLFFIMTFLLFSFFRRLTNKYFALILICGLLLTYVSMELVSTLIPQAEGGFRQRDRIYSNTYMQILNVINPFISPYPALNIKNNQITNVQVSVFASYNIVLSYFVIMGIFKSIRDKMYALFPIILVLMLNSIMLIAYGFSMNYRYIYITSPLMFIFIPYGELCYKKRTFIPYVLMIVSITLLYNVR